MFSGVIGKRKKENVLVAFDATDLTLSG